MSVQSVSSAMAGDVTMATGQAGKAKSKPSVSEKINDVFQPTAADAIALGAGIATFFPAVKNRTRLHGHLQTLVCLAGAVSLIGMFWSDLRHAISISNIGKKLGLIKDQPKPESQGFSATG